MKAACFLGARKKVENGQEKLNYHQDILLLDEETLTYIISGPQGEIKFCKSVRYCPFKTFLNRFVFPEGD